MCDTYQPVPARKADHEYSGAEPESFPPLFWICDWDLRGRRIDSSFIPGCSGSAIIKSNTVKLETLILHTKKKKINKKSSLKDIDWKYLGHLGAAETGCKHDTYYHLLSWRKLNLNLPSFVEQSNFQHLNRITKFWIHIFCMYTTCPTANNTFTPVMRVKVTL